MVSHDGVQRRTAELSIDIPAPQVVEETNFDLCPRTGFNSVVLSRTSKILAVPVRQMTGWLEVPKMVCETESSDGLPSRSSTRERLSGRMCEQIGGIEVPKVSSQERVEAVNSSSGVNYGK